MKKLVLVLVLVLAFSFTALANPFVDVPLNHWAYDSVQSLAAKGVIVGFPDGTFGGEKSLTRYEMAEATAKALAVVEGMGYASAADVLILEKLAIEFAEELAGLGLTVFDIEAALGANSEAIAALEETVGKLDTFFDPVVITGDIAVDWEKQILPTMSVATIKDTTEIGLEAEINDTTVFGIEMEFENVLNENVNLDVDSWKFWIEHEGEDLHLIIDEIDLEDENIGLGLIYAFDGENGIEEFWGAWAQWGMGDDDDLGTWTLFFDVENFYVLNIGFEVGDDDIPVGVTASYDPLALGFAAGLDLSFDIGDEDESTVTLEAGLFSGAALAFAGAGSLSSEFDDFNLDVDVYYIQPGFVPSNTDYAADLLGVDVTVGFPISDEDADTQVDAEASWTYEMDAAFAANLTHEVGAELAFTIDEDNDEEAMVGVSFDVLTGGVEIEGNYMNLPLGDDTEFVLSAAAEYAMLTGDYMAVATLVYDFEDDMVLLLEVRTDTDGAAVYSAEIALEWELAENTDLVVGFEFNDWEDDINDYDDLEISGTDSMLYAEIDVDF